MLGTFPDDSVFPSHLTNNPPGEVANIDQFLGMDPQQFATSDMSIDTALWYETSGLQYVDVASLGPLY
jgi:hypothetical protein